MILLLTLLVLLAGCSSTPAEEQVRAAIERGAAAAEQGDAGALDALLTEDFIGNDGVLDRRRLVAMLRVNRLRGRNVTVLVGPLSFEARGERLLASFTATLSGGGRVLPDEMGVFQVRTAWRLEDGDWRCYSAHWTRKL